VTYSISFSPCNNSLDSFSSKEGQMPDNMDKILPNKCAETA